MKETSIKTYCKEQNCGIQLRILKDDDEEEVLVGGGR